MKDATNRRSGPRRSLNSLVSIRVGPHSGRLLDVSDAGLRFELDWPADDEIPATMTLLLGISSVAIPVIVAWKSRQGDRPWTCGALVSSDGKAEWRRIVAML